MAEKRELKKIKSSVFTRGLSLAKMTLKTSSQIASHSLTTLLNDDETKAKKWTQLLNGQLQTLSTELGELKGSLMKAGQMLSMYSQHFLPEEAQKALSQLYSSTPPLRWPEIEKILRSEFTNEQFAQLEIDPVPIGTASIGQVHKAKLVHAKDPTWIALKIQYPGVDRAIESDLRALKSIFNLMSIVPKGYDMEAMFSEIREMMYQEVDYKKEATLTEEYAKKLAGDSRYIIPRVYPEFSTSRVLATEFVSGLPPDATAVLNLSQERRNLLAENFLDLYMREFYHWGVVQTDPHFGNYRIRINSEGKDQIVLLDFGAVRTYQPDFLAAYQTMILAALKKDPAKIEAATKNLSFISESTDPQVREQFIHFCTMTVEPFRGGIYDFRSSDLPQRLTKSAFDMIKSFKLNPPPKEVIFLDRKTSGVFVFLSVIGAKIDPSLLLKKYIGNY